MMRALTALAMTALCVVSVTSLHAQTGLDALAAADLQARRLDTREAPQRELARQKSEANAALAAQDKARTANKAAFTP